MKKFAIFLPQFHEIPENNEWWGDGFTEWTKVKEAQPLFKGHEQPKLPLNSNYYNLLEKDTVIWHTDLMKKYHIDGLAYYHYYFKGKLLLEKPAENLLKWKDIDQKFFFIWANHSWIRSWEGTQELLMKQEYGVEADWEKHFQYLLPFFKDPRYEKKDNMPLFAIFSSNIPCRDKMFKYIDKRCKEEGFNGIHLIEFYSGGSIRRSNLECWKTYYKSLCPETKSVHIRQPMFATNYKTNIFIKIFENYKKQFCRSKYNKFSMMFKLDGDKILKRCMNFRFPESKVNLIRGVFFEWDNTPRHKYRGYIIKPISKTIFFKYMNTLKSDEYVLINAWNEWAEGMILEPTEKHGYQYLEWIKEWSEENC